MTATYRGQPIEYVVHNRKADTYTLIDADGYSLAEMSPAAFLALPNRQNLEVRSGRYRAAGSKDQRGAAGKSGQSGGNDAIDAFLYATGPFITGTRAGTGKSAGLTIADMVQSQRHLNRVMMSRSSSWAAPAGPLFMMSDWLETEQRPPLKRDGVIAGEIVGYRCWRIARGDPSTLIGRLRSVYQSDVWNPGGILQGRELGDWDSRGIHAWKDSGSKEYHAYIRGYLNRGSNDPFLFAFNNGDDPNPDLRPAMVTGTVFLWGDVVEHERGWRAEFARVRSLDWLYPDAIMMGREQETLNNLRRLYGVQ